MRRPREVTALFGTHMPQRKDLDVLVVVAHRQQPQHREGVRDAEVCQS
jgi:hypothetical protein